MVITATGSMVTIIQYTSYQGEDIVEKYSINFFGIWKKTMEPNESEYPGQYNSESGIYQDFGLDYIPFPFYGTVMILIGFFIIIIGSIFSIFLDNKFIAWTQLVLLIVGTILLSIGLFVILLFGFEMFEPFISQLYIRTEEISIDFGFSLRFGWGFLLLSFSPFLNFLNIIALILFKIQRPSNDTNELMFVTKKTNI